MPTVCNGCGEAFTLSHALDWCHGGLVTQRHNEVRDILGDIAALASKEIIREPVLHKQTGRSSALELLTWSSWCLGSTSASLV